MGSMGNDNGASASGLRKITTNSSITDRHHVPSGPNMVDADLPSLKYIISNLSRHGDRHPEPNPSPANGDGQQQQRESSDGTDRSPITPLGREKSDGEAPAGLEEGDTPKASLPTEHTYPEGGVAAYTVVFGSFVSMIACFGIMNTIGSLQTHLHQNQLKSYSEGEVGWIFGLYAFLSFFGGIWIGPVFDRKGPQVLLAVGSVLLVASLVILGHCTAYWHFILDFGVLAGLGTSLIFTPAVASIGHWFAVKRAWATGLATTGGSIGGIIFPLVIQNLSPRVGFPWACRVLALICAVLLLLGNFFIRTRLVFVSKSSPSSNTSSSSLVGSDKNQKKAAATLPSTLLKKTLYAFSLIDLKAFLDPRFTLTTLGVFLIEWGIFTPLTYLTSYSIHLGLSPSLSYQLISFLNAGSVFGRWLPGLIADKWGRFNTMIITVSFCFLVVMTIWLPSSFIPLSSSSSEADKQKVTAILILFSVLYGFGSGSGISLTPVCVGQICSIEDYGTKYGTCYFFVSFGTLTGIPIAGQIAALGRGGGSVGSVGEGGEGVEGNMEGYRGLILFTAASYVGALGFFVAARWAGGVKTLRGIY